jgi:predicted  nucleic acid-binding Zn-ribbon protein
METTNVTIVNATTDFLQSQIVAKDENIAELIQTIDGSHRRYTSVKNLYDTLRDSLENWTKEQYKDGQLTEEQAEELAATVGFELTEEVEVIVTVEYSLTVNVPLGEDAESIVNDIDFETVQYNDEHISYLTGMVTSIDI